MSDLKLLAETMRDWSDAAGDHHWQAGCAIDRLTAENEALKAEVERLRALWEKETERAHVAEGELLKSRVRLVTRKQECDQLFADNQSWQLKHDILLAKIEAIQLRDCQRDADVIERFVEALTSGQTLKLHNMRPDERAKYANQLRKQAKEVQ